MFHVEHMEVKMLEKIEIKDWLELNAKLQQKKNELRNVLQQKGILKKGLLAL